MVGRGQAEKVISTFETFLNRADDEATKKEKEMAEKYNQNLFRSQTSVGANIKKKWLREDYYEQMLNPMKTGVMGSIEIPQIDVKLPLYHGTSEEVLSVGVGHFYGSSLPVGGANTHCVLTGHRGLPNAKLFTRLDELKKGDLFYINGCEEELIYQVCSITVIEPEEVEALAIRDKEDLVSLVTCTPYGINTHRLVVTGKRIFLSETKKDSIKKRPWKARDVIFASLPFVFIIVEVVVVIKKRKERKHEK